MNKKQLQALVDSLNLSKEEYYILGGGSLLLCGLRDIANDLDLCVTPQAFEVLSNNTISI